MQKGRYISFLKERSKLGLVIVAALVIGAAFIWDGSPSRAALPAPGGVEGVVLWLKANGTGLVVNGSNQVEHWDDQSGGTFIATQAQASSPSHTDTITPTDSILKVDNGVNFNPAVDFSGATGRTLKGSSVSAWSSANLQIFSAASAEAAPAGNLSAVFAINGTWTSGGGVSGGGLGYLGSTKSYYLDGSGCSVATASAPDGPHIARGAYVSATSGLGGTTWLDGVQKATGTSCGKSSTHSFFEIGGRTTGTFDNRVFNGKIPEVIVYTSALAATEAQRVDSYLAIKYGVTLGSNTLDYLASNGTTKAWDAAANTGYYNNITGIGRDDNSALNQKQSKSVNAQGLVTVGQGAITADNASNTNNFSANNSFLMFGDDNGDINSWVDTGVPALDVQDFKQIPRKWKVQKTGTVGNVAVSFDVNDPDANIASPLNNYYLLNLTTGTATPLTSTDGSNYSASGINFNNGDVFTVGTFDIQYNVHFKKTVSPVATSITPGQTFTYTITAENLGNVPQTGLSFFDDLTDVIDDAAYNSDVNATIGSATFNGGNNHIEWNGTLGVSQIATITYSLTMNQPTTGDGRLDNGVVASGTGVNCTEDPAVDPDCLTTTPLPVVVTQKTLVNPANPEAGDTVDYQFVITNQGGAAATTVPVADDLSGVLDDATYNNDATATSGTLSYNPLTKRLSWSGSLAANGNAGDSVTVTYSVQINAATTLDDAVLNNAVISPDCPSAPIFDPGDPGYEANCVTSTSVSAWMATKAVSPTSGIKPGDTATYTVTVKNTGAVNLTGLSLDDDMTDVLDDADYNNDVNATNGAPTFTSPTLSWLGDLTSGQTATITYTAMVKSEDSLGNNALANAIGAGPMNCPVTPTTNASDPNFNATCAVLSAIALGTPTGPPGSGDPGNGTSTPDQNSGGLANTGQSIALIAGIAILLIGGGVAILLKNKSLSIRKKKK